LLYNLYMNKIDGFTCIQMSKELEVNEFVSFHYFEYPKDFFFPGEKHDFWEFLYVDRGDVYVSCDGKPKTLLTQGQMIFHKPNEFHTVECDKVVSPSLVVISFVCNSPCMSFFENKILRITNHSRFLLSLVMDETRRIFSTNLANPFYRELDFANPVPFSAQTLVRNYFECFLLDIITSNNPQGEGIKAISKTTELETTRERFLEAQEYMLLHISDNLSLDEICHDCSMSKANIQNVFRKETQMSVIEYYNSRKIDEAKKRIREGKGTMTTIAYSLGYNSIHYFSRQFHKFAGMSPVEYSRSIKSVLADKGAQYRN